MEWFRWYGGTVEDKKWRAIARRSKSSVAEVVAVWAALCENANESPERGTLDGWDPEDVAAALDLETEKVDAITDAMQGKVLSGPVLTGWEKRNPPSDSSTERVRRHRSKKAGETVTQRSVTAQEREKEIEGEREISAAIISLHGREARAEKDRVVDGIMIAANQGMRANPAIGENYTPIATNHASRQVVFDWLAKGIPPDVAREAVFQKAKEYRADGRNQQVTSMNYFDKPVTEAFQRHQAATTEKPNGAERLPRAGRVGEEAGRGAPAKRDRYATLYETG